MDVTIEQELDAEHDGLVQLIKFHNEHIEPYVQSQMQLDSTFPREKSLDAAIMGIYYRMLCWMQSLSLLNTENHFQAGAACSRALFELLVDMVILKEDGSNEQVEKYYAFGYLEICKFAENLKKLRNNDKFKNLWLGDLNSILANLDNSAANSVRDKASKLWINNKGKPYIPDHWSGKDLRTRVANLTDRKYLAHCEQIYKPLSWAVHPGYAVFVGAENKNSLKYNFGLSIYLSRKIFIEVIRIFAAHMSIDKGVKNFHKVLSEAGAYPQITLRKRASNTPTKSGTENEP